MQLGYLEQNNILESKYVGLEQIGIKSLILYKNSPIVVNGIYFQVRVVMIAA